VTQRLVASFEAVTGRVGRLVTGGEGHPGWASDGACVTIGPICFFSAGKFTAPAWVTVRDSDGMNVFARKIVDD
jgi:hypothetical protein